MRPDRRRRPNKKRREEVEAEATTPQAPLPRIWRRAVKQGAAPPSKGRGVPSFDARFAETSWLLAVLLVGRSRRRQSSGSAGSSACLLPHRCETVEQESIEPRQLGNGDQDLPRLGMSDNASSTASMRGLSSRRAAPVGLHSPSRWEPAEARPKRAFGRALTAAGVDRSGDIRMFREDIRLNFRLERCGLCWQQRVLGPRDSGKSQSRGLTVPTPPQMPGEQVPGCGSAATRSGTHGASRSGATVPRDLFLWTRTSRPPPPEAFYGSPRPEHHPGLSFRCLLGQWAARVHFSPRRHLPN